jgi:DNA-binding SARP family transcriptional activator
VQFLVLGPFEVHGDNGSLAIGSPKERRLLALLVASRGAVVSADVLIDGVWDGRPPRSAGKTLQGYVVHLRRVLADGDDPARPLRTRGSGYVLDIPANAVDAGRFRDLVAAGRRASEARDWGRASALLGNALALWRGPPYAEFGGAECFEGEVRSLGELRHIATETRIDADLALDRGADLVPELEKLLAEHPTRERLWTQLMRALYRSGRQADALAAYRRARDRLIDELGIEPGPELRATEAAVLAHDARLQAPEVNDGWTPWPTGTLEQRWAVVRGQAGRPRPAAQPLG